jgi:hypothetical protein
MTADRRSLGIGRIALALVLMLDLRNRWAELPLWYTNLGLLPNHTLLWRPTFPFAFSLFWGASYAHEATACFILCFVAYLALLLGFHTRLAQIASLVCVLSLHARVSFTQSGGDVVLGELALWTVFLPTGSRFSLDAVRKRLTGVAEVDEDERPVVSLAMLAIVLQLAMIYGLNAAQKSGETWKSGTAVYYVLHQSRIVTPFGLWTREVLPVSWLRAATWATLGIEWSVPFLLMSPMLTPAARLLGITLIWFLHVSLGLCLDLASFPAAMIAFTPNLLPSEVWTIASRFLRRRQGYVRIANGLDRGLSTLARVTLRFDPVRLDGTTGCNRWQSVGGNVAVATVMLLAASQLAAENPILQRVVTSRQPLLVTAAVQYLQLFQGWSMFAPDAPRSDMNLIVDADTVNGRHVDPFNEVASRAFRNPGPTLPARLGQSILFCDYLTRIEYNPAYYQAFTEWILRYPERTHNDLDRITSFRVLAVEQDTRPPGERISTSPHTRLIFAYPR